MLLAHTQSAKQYNYAIHKKIIGLIKIINCCYTVGSGWGPATLVQVGTFLVQSGQLFVTGQMISLGDDAESLTLRSLPCIRNT